jgi:hypothetical protein
VSSSDLVREKAISAFQRARHIAENSDAPELTLDEINQEISLAREERAKYNKE